MKSKYIQILTILLAVFLYTGCSEDFLTVEQQGVIAEETFYSTDEEALQALLGCYDELQYIYHTYYSYLQTLTVLSDEAYCGGSSRGDASTLEEIDEFRYGSDNSVIENLFTWWYYTIYRTNKVLTKVTDDSDAKHIIMAEAKAIRAYSYFELLITYGAVPLVLEPLSPSEYAQPRAEESEIWAQIETDLLEAIDVLPLRSEQSEADKARISKGTAQAILGKVYLFEEKYDDAADILDEVITSGEYSLYPDFSKILRIESELGVESVFEITQSSTMGYSYSSSSYGETAGIFYFYSPKGSGWFDGDAFGMWASGWGFTNAKYSLYQAFVDAGDDVRRESTIWSESEVIANGGKLRNTAYATTDLPEGTLAWSTDSCLRLKYGTWISESDETGVVGLNFGTNFRLIRYADVLLMAAEAYNRKSVPDDSKALEYINEVRDRVTLTSLTVTGDDLFDAIKTERRLELAFEGQRYQDLVRWGDAATVLADEGKQIPRGDGTFYEVSDAGFSSKNVVFPIPEQELTVNPNMTQNDGY